MINLIHLLPDYEQNSKVFKEALKGIEAVLKKCDYIADIVERNIFVSTAVENLDYLIDELQLDSRNLSTEEKREIIRSRYWSMHGAIQEKDIKKVCKAFTNGDIEIIRKENHGDYVFKFISILGKPKKLDLLNDSLKRLIHSGYQWEFEFKYNTWLDVRNAKTKWSTNKTWEQLKGEAL